MSQKEFHEINAIIAHLDAGGVMDCAVVQNLDLAPLESRLMNVSITDTIFMGCTLSDVFICYASHNGGVIFPKLSGLNFEPYRSTLYTRDVLFAGFDAALPCSYCDTTDAKIYQHWAATGRSQPHSTREALSRRLHDMSITEVIIGHMAAIDPSKVVAIMGGHNMARDSAAYRNVVLISQQLTRGGYYLISGGGPGAMEATHLGAMLVDADTGEIDRALAILGQAPTYKDELWLSKAYEVLDGFLPSGGGGESLGIPTWLYGHEPPTPFASHIAKYFSNSVREEGLITLAVGGIVFAPGNAGTIQEVFQDAAQNRYATTGKISPMIFLDEHYWTVDKPIYNVMKSLAAPYDYGKMIGIADTVDDVVAFIKDNPPFETDKAGFVFCDLFCGAEEKNA